MGLDSRITFFKNKYLLFLQTNSIPERKKLHIRYFLYILYIGQVMNHNIENKTIYIADIISTLDINTKTEQTSNRVKKNQRPIAMLN